MKNNLVTETPDELTGMAERDIITVNVLLPKKQTFICQKEKQEMNMAYL